MFITRRVFNERGQAIRIPRFLSIRLRRRGVDLGLGVYGLGFRGLGV